MRKVKRLFYGKNAKVYLLLNDDGSSDVETELRKMDKRMNAKVVKILRAFCDIGEIKNTEKFRNEGDGIYAFKIGQLRLLGFFLPDTEIKSQLIVHSYWKKSKRAPKRELEKSKSLKADVLREGYEYTE